ncbi:MAG: hypothetical protein FIA91_12860 [Geobacter sp.]|nr:hypothetical protein [Geobacter sp.]
MFRLFLLSCTLFCAVTTAFAADGPERLLVHFATVGDSRHDPEAADITAQDRLWLQNTKVLARMIREMQSVKPELLFFNGDMINGYTSDRSLLDRQYAYWRGMAAHLMESGTYVVPVPGNHETQVKTRDDKGRAVKLAMAVNEDAWRANMGDLIIDRLRWQTLLGSGVEAWSANNRPLAGGPDGIKSEQRQLSYSFDFRGLHFLVINTDAVGNDGKAPVAWLKGDLESAAKRGVTGYFIFGHRPAYTYRFKPAAETAGLDLFPENQKAFWDLVEQYNAVYFCGHEHIFNLMQPRKGEGGKAWQLLVGSGGSPFDARAGESSRPEDRFYAWAEVSVYSTGRVHLKIHGFDEFFGATKVILDRDL